MQRRRSPDLRLVTLILLTALALASRPRPAVARQADGVRWSVTTSDFETRRGRLLAVGDAGVTIQPANETQQAVARSSFVRMERLDPSGTGVAASTSTDRDGDDAFVLHLRDGDRLRGTPTALGETAMTVHTDLVGDVDVPLEQLLALTRGAAGGRPWREVAPPSDEILLANGDRLAGYVSAVDGGTMTVTDRGNNPFPVDVSAVRQVRFADPGLPSPPPPENGWRVTTAAGSTFTTESLTYGDGEFAATYRGRRLTLAERDVLVVEQSGGPVVWLSDLFPSVDEQTPYLSARFDTRTDGLREGSGRGFAVHSRSVLRFDVPPGYERFRVRYKLADDSSRGDVSVAIKFDDRLVHSVEHLRSGDAPAPVDLPLDGATSITLEVGYGAGLDVDDSFVWIDPALVRGK